VEDLYVLVPLFVGIVVDGHSVPSDLLVCLLWLKGGSDALLA
jgi:hypothetical protein